MDFTTDNVDEISAYIRFWLGGVDQSIVSDDTLNYIVQMVIDSHPEYTGCDVIYHSTLQLLDWLIRKQTNGSSPSGEVKNLKEKIGAVEIVTEYNVASPTSDGSGWESIKNSLINDPHSIGCVVSVNPNYNNTGKVVIGGVSQREYNRVKCDPDSRNGYSVRSPYRGRDFLYREPCIPCPSGTTPTPTPSNSLYDEHGVIQEDGIIIADEIIPSGD